MNESNVINPGVKTDELAVLLSSLTHKYEVALRSLPSEENSNIEERVRERSAKVQEIALDLAMDLTTLSRYRFSQSTRYNTYYVKQIDDAIQFLRELRQDLSLYISAEKL